MHMSWQTFRDGSVHIRCVCSRCERFVKFLRRPARPRLTLLEMLVWLVDAGVVHLWRQGTTIRTMGPTAWTDELRTEFMLHLDRLLALASRNPRPPKGKLP